MTLANNTVQYNIASANDTINIVWDKPMLPLKNGLLYPMMSFNKIWHKPIICFNIIWV